VDSSKPLEEIVANRRWQKRLKPFPHILVRDLFIPSVAEEIDTAVRKVLEDERMAAIARYDASGWGFRSDMDWPLRIFTTDAWRNLIAGVLGVETIPYVSGGIHHHDVGGESGKPHNDLNPVYFAETDPRDGVVTMRGDLVDLKSGETLHGSPEIRRTVRAVSILYYTANPPWRRGDGGATGLYRQRSDNVNSPAVFVPPLNNSLVAFECTPCSFHSFISNRVSERNSITMWLHRSDTMAVDRWSEYLLERWPESPPAPPFAEATADT
jgi:hypothetical protein